MIACNILKSLDAPTLGVLSARAKQVICLAQAAVIRCRGEKRECLRKKIFSLQFGHRRLLPTMLEVDV